MIGAQQQPQCRSAEETSHQKLKLKTTMMKAAAAAAAVGVRQRSSSRFVCPHTLSFVTSGIEGRRDGVRTQTRLYALSGHFIFCQDTHG